MPKREKEVYSSGKRTNKKSNQMLSLLIITLLKQNKEISCASILFQSPAELLE